MVVVNVAWFGDLKRNLVVLHLRIVLIYYFDSPQIGIFRFNIFDQTTEFMGSIGLNEELMLSRSYTEHIRVDKVVPNSAYP